MIAIMIALVLAGSGGTSGITASKNKEAKARKAHIARQKHIIDALAREAKGAHLFLITDRDEEVLALADIISELESRWQYKAIGQVNNNGTRDYGRYQFNSSNLKRWSGECLKIQLTAVEVLNYPRAQNMIGRCMVRKCLGQRKYWDQCLAIWNSGRPFVRTGPDGKLSKRREWIWQYVEKGIKKAEKKYPRWKKNFRSPGGIKRKPLKHKTIVVKGGKS